MAGRDEKFKLRSLSEYKIRMAKESIETPGDAQRGAISYLYGKSEKWADVVIGPYDGQNYDVAIAKQLTGQLIHAELEGQIATNLYIITVLQDSSAGIDIRLLDDFSLITGEHFEEGSGESQLAGANGITCDGIYLYICDGGNHRIKKVRKDDLSFVSMIGSEGAGDDQFFYPQGIAVDNTYLYICDSWNYRIQKRLKSDLSFVSNVGGSQGSGDDQFHDPIGITCDDTYIYVCDDWNNRVQKRLKSDLSFVSQAGSFGDGDNELNHPHGITCDNTYLYICDFWNERIVKWRKSDLSFVSTELTGGIWTPPPYPIYHPYYPLWADCDDTYLYLMLSGWGDLLQKRLKSNLSLVSELRMVDTTNRRSATLNGIAIG